MRRLLLATTVLIAAACSSGTPVADSDGTWVGTITTEGNVTTVVNESGSVWGGTARLVEEASIGVESGADEYMFGEIGAVRVLDGEIYVVERSASAVRVYDLSGAHLRSFGRRGQGPGELGRFVFDVAMGPEGRIYVGDFSNRRINIYSRAGEPIDEIPLPGRVACCRVPLVFADGGGVWLHVRVAGEDGQASRDAVRVHDADGPVGEALFVPEIEYDRRVFRLGVRDVEVIERGGGTSLLLESGQPLGVGSVLLRQHLDRHLAAQARVLAEVHLSHAALTERFKDLVMT